MCARRGRLPGVNTPCCSGPASTPCGPASIWAPAWVWPGCCAGPTMTWPRGARPAHRGRAGGHPAATSVSTTGCWCGPRTTPAPARSTSAATTGSGRWRCCRTGGWPPAAATAGCGCGMCEAAHLAVCSHAPRTRSLPPPHHLELASSSVTQEAEFHAGRYAQRHRTRLEPGNVRVTRCNNRRECLQVRGVNGGPGDEQLSRLRYGRL
jgi:hypothetical protein